MAFDTVKIGKKIAKLRREKNMTQMELADALGVSYQAVSNWERGNSMPDISKLPELVEMLGCSIDELLSDSHDIGLIKHVIEGNAQDYIKENEVTAKDLGTVAPILKPAQTEELMDHILEKNENKFSLNDLISLAPFLDEDYLDKLVDEIDVVENIECIIGLAPFLSDETLNKLADKIQVCGNLSQLKALAPFLSEDALDKLVRKGYQGGNINEIAGLAPFLNEETLDYLATKAMENGKVSELSCLYPFLSDKTLHMIADRIVKEKGFSAIKDIATFL